VLGALHPRYQLLSSTLAIVSYTYGLLFVLFARAPTLLLYALLLLMALAVLVGALIGHQRPKLHRAGDLALLAILLGCTALLDALVFAIWRCVYILLYMEVCV
jgi:hypothetical protein